MSQYLTDNMSAFYVKGARLWGLWWPMSLTVADPVGGGGAQGTISPPRPGEQNLCILKLRDLYNLAVADSLFFQDLQVM